MRGHDRWAGRLVPYPFPPGVGKLQVELAAPLAALRRGREFEDFGWQSGGILRGGMVDSPLVTPLVLDD